MEQTQSNNRKGIQIAIADDYKMLLELLVDRINSLKNCTIVFAAENGQQLIDYLENCPKLPDLVILDISMPVLNGYETQIILSQRWPELATLAMSIYDDEDCVVQMLKNGAKGFFCKNWGVEKMEEAILAIYIHGSYSANVSPDNISLQSKGIPTITLREKEYLTLTCTGISMEHIAEQMGVSFRTVEHYRDNLHRKLNVSNKAELILYVKRTGLVFMK